MGHGMEMFRHTGLINNFFNPFFLIFLGPAFQTERHIVKDTQVREEGKILETETGFAFFRGKGKEPLVTSSLSIRTFPLSGVSSPAQIRKC